MKIFPKSILFFAIIFYSTPVLTQTVENGVSRALSASRSKVLSNVRYELSFLIPLNREDPIKANEIISFYLKENQSSLQLDFKEASNHIVHVVVNGTKTPFQFRNEHIVIDKTYLKQGENSIHIVFIAGELSLNRNNEYLYTLLVPDRARTVFPCFDQPDIKARFRLQLSVPNTWKALGNALVQSVKDSGNIKNYVFQESDLFSTYLFSFVAGSFSEVQKQPGDHLMHFYFRETDSSKIKLSIDTIFKSHKTAIDFLESYTQIKFPFQKLDFAAIPDFQYGGMEHVGTIDYKASSLFLDSGATKDQQNARSSLIAHETSHMWFGNLVTMKWFDDVWMKEVFANFMADKFTQGNKADDSYELRFLLTHFPRAYAVDRTEGANPIRQDLHNLNQAGSLYGPIIYDKAPVMMRQLERLMGANSFREGLREYLKQYSYSNASWPNLVSILDQRTTVDLQKWNRAWVNTPGRPVFNYSLKSTKGLLSDFIITQKGERSANYLLPQVFEIALIYSDHIQEFTVNMNQKQVHVKEAESNQPPLFILFNSSGQGYGVFPFDKKSLPLFENLKDPLMRASAYINLYENMLNGTNISVKELYKFLISRLSAENEELNLSLISSYVGDIYWRLLLPAERKQAAPYLENLLWESLHKEPSPGKKKILFRTYQNIAISTVSLDTLYQIWKNQTPPEGVKLSEDEYTSLALNLVLKEFPDTTILSKEYLRVTNIDRKQRLEFLIPAVSKDKRVRDVFFQSLKDINIRKKESWVADALAYLHHPLRATTSMEYLEQSLNMLEEIQRTNDIFFPGTWLNTSFGSYQSKQAADILTSFLKTHPNYNPQLKMKILQAADPVFRAQKLKIKP